MAELRAEAAFKKEEKKASAQGRAKAHAADPDYHRCVAVAHGTDDRCLSRGRVQVAQTEDWMCKTHFMGAMAKEKREALDPNYRPCSAISLGTRMRCHNGATKQVYGSEDWLCTHHFQLALTKVSRPKASESEGHKLAGEEEKKD